MAKMSAIFYLGVNDLCVDEGLLGSRIEMQVDTGKLVILFPKLDEKNFAVPRTTLAVAGYSGSHEEGGLRAYKVRVLGVYAEFERDRRPNGSTCSAGVPVATPQDRRRAALAFPPRLGSAEAIDVPRTL